MRLRLSGREQLDAALRAFRGGAGVAAKEEEKLFAIFRKVLRANIELCDEQAGRGVLAEVAEQEELLEQKTAEVAFRRLELARTCRREYEEACSAAVREVDGITRALEGGDIFSPEASGAHARRFSGSR